MSNKEDYSKTSLGRLVGDHYLTVSRSFHPMTIYTNAPENGRFTEFFENGDLAEEGYFKNGKFHGTWTFWFPNGKKCWEGFYHKDTQVGKWTEWDEKGEIVIIIYYKDGEIDEERTHSEMGMY